MMKKLNINKLLRKDLDKLEAYVPGESASELSRRYQVSLEKLTKLNANENPFGPSPSAKKAILNAFLNYYPSSNYTILKEELAKYNGVNSNQIIVSNGSDELIDLLLRLVISPKEKVLICPPTYGMYEILTKLNKGNLIQILRNKDYSLNIEKVLKGINKDVKIIFLCNPNSPTGNLTLKEDIEKILQTGKLAIVDETYFEFAKITQIPLLKKYPNLVILRTLSKWAGLAGLRLGYAIANPFLISQLTKIKQPYPVNVIAEFAAIATLQDLTFSKQCIDKIIQERERIYKKLSSLQQIKIYPSLGNYLFLQIQDNTYQELKQTFEENKIALRYYDSPLATKSIRITIGKPVQNNKIISIFKSFYGKNKLKKYAFLDRDGTLIFEPQDTYQVDSLKKLKILNGAIKGLIELTGKGYELIMVSNQDGMGTASFPKVNFEIPQKQMLNIFARKNIKFKKIFICPHLPSDDCTCRKPKIGLVRKLLKTNDYNKNYSFMCGDRKTDKSFAENIGVKFISMKTNGNFYKALLQGGIL